MREIKFRAWDKVAGAMSPAFVLFGEFTLLGAVHDWQYHVLIENRGAWEDAKRYDSLGRLNDLEIMQFTGMQDKNGKEIYEGDICRVRDQYADDEIVMEVRFADGAFFIHWDNHFCGGDADLTTIAWAMVEGHEFEVIGNIFENPELLQ